MGEVLIQIWLKSMKLLDKEVNVQNESLFRGSCKLPQAHKKCVMKMKERKNDCHLKICDERKDFIRLYQKTGWTDFNELQVIDSSNNEGTNSQVMGELGGKG